MSLYGCFSELLFNAARPFLNRKYDEGNEQRYGVYPQDLPKGALWIHAVSVGEVQSAYPLVKEIKKQDPGLPILLSTITKTGKAMSEQLMRDSVTRIYYPWDAPSVLNRALDTLRPKAYVTMETEIWPEMLRQLQKRGIPAFLVNGRLSESSFAKYNRFHSFWSQVIRRYRVIMARSEAERARFVALGADPCCVRVTGDCKVDALIERRNAADLARLSVYFQSDAPVILAGSTHEGEETVVFKAYRALLEKHPRLRLVVVPRHPERSETLLREAQERQLPNPVLMSKAGEGWQVLIVDRIGLLFSIYGCVKAAFLGGSIAPKGGQNIMEPALWGIPFCQGPDYRDFTEATEGLLAAGLCKIVHDDREMAQFFEDILASGYDERYKAGSRTFFDRLGGASRRSWEIMREQIG